MTNASMTEQPLETAEHRPTGPILVATDGMPQSDGAIATAHALAAMLGTDLRIVAVHRPLGLVVPDVPELFDPHMKVKLTADLTGLVRSQCTRVVTRPGAVRIHEPEVRTGDPPREVSRLAESIGAQLVVSGIGAHEVLDRIFGDETALKLARLSHVPVLAVPQQGLTVPRRALVGVDFSEGSVRAAQVALRLMPPGSTLHLVHVVPRERQLVDPWLTEKEYDRLARHNFRRLRARLGEPPGLTITDTIRVGDAGRVLLAYADEVKAELVVTGSHGHGFVSRLVLGSITTKVLRGATCAVLVVPPVEFPVTTGDGDGRRVTTHVDRGRWSDLLDDFTRANSGRRTELEIDDPEMGAQAQEHDYPLLGVTFDPHDSRIEIMLGHAGRGEAHLSRSIGDVRSVDVLSDGHGRDMALRLRHGQGQTILSLVT